MKENNTNNNNNNKSLFIIIKQGVITSLALYHSSIQLAIISSHSESKGRNCFPAVDTSEERNIKGF